MMDQHEQPDRLDDLWDDMGAILEGDPSTLEQHEDFLADVDDARDARFEAEKVVALLEDAGADYQPIDMKSRIVAALDEGTGLSTKAPSENASTSQEEDPPRSPHPSEPPGPPSPSEPLSALESATGEKADAEPASSRRAVRPWMVAGAIGSVAALAAGAILFIQSGPEAEETSPTALRAEAIDVLRAAADQRGGFARLVPGGTPVPIQPGDAIDAGSQLETDDRTRALLSLSDGSTLTLNHRTSVALRAEAPRSLHLATGEVLAEVAPTGDGPAAHFTTPEGRVEILGTKFLLTSADGRTSVQVLRGSVLLHGRSDTLTVEKGQEGVITGDGKASLAPLTQIARRTRWTELAPTEGTDGIKGLGELRARLPGEQRERERPLTLSEHRVNVRIVGNVARTEVEQAFRNDSRQTLEGIYRFPLPPDARIASLELLVEDRWEDGAFVERERAAQIWRGVIRNATPEAQRRRPVEEVIWAPGPWRDPALLEWQKGGRFELKIFPIPARGERRVRLSYTQTLPPQGNQRRYTYPLAHSRDGSVQAGSFHAEVRVANATLETPGSYPVSSRQDGHETVVSYDATDFIPSGDLAIDFKRQDSDAELQWWTYEGNATAAPPERSREDNEAVIAEHQRLHADARGYVVFALRPELPAWNEGPPRDYVLVVDRSQSMIGERYERAAALTAQIVSELDRRDRFQVLACDATCARMSDGPRPASARAAGEVEEWLGTQQAGGASNLVAALGNAAGERTDRERQVIYIGDGSPTVGYRQVSSVAVEVATLRETTGAHFTTVGVGGDADILTLRAVARAGDGHYLPYTAGQPIAEAAWSVLETSYGVSLSDAELRFPDGIEAVAPAVLPNLRSGEELLVTARITGPVQGEVRLTGRIGGESFETAYPVDIALSRAAGNAFVPRQWAMAQVDELEVGGKAADEPRIIALSKAFGVLSRHTSLLVLESEAMFRAFRVDRARPTIEWDGSVMESGSTRRSARARRPERQSLSAWSARSAPAVPAPSAMETASRAPRGPAVSRGRSRRSGRARRRRRRTAWILGPRAPGRWSELQVERAQAELDLNPDSRDRHRVLARALSTLGDLERTEEVVRAWMGRDALDPEPLLFLADILGRTGRRAEAIQALGGTIDLEPNEARLQERLARAFERMGDAERACAHRIALAEIENDARSIGDAMRCEQSQDRPAAVRRLLDRLTEPDDRARAEEIAGAPPPELSRGGFTLDATWDGDEDLDLSVISTTGTRVSWLGGRRALYSRDPNSTAREELGLPRLGMGFYRLEIARSQPGTHPIRGEVRVRARGQTRTLPFELTGDHTHVGSITIPW
ncbi:MAG: VIT domain-containing protein [Myxococcota bacterium]